MHFHCSQKNNDLAGEHVFTDIGQLILFIIFVSVIIVDLFLLKFSTRIIGPLPSILAVPIFLLFFINGSYFIIKSHRIVFGKKEKEAGLVTKDVFRIVRHPMYFGSILLFLSFVILSYSLLAFLVWVVICLFYYFVSRHEEKLLSNKFGNAYKKYKEKVPMFIPFLK